MIEGKRFPVFDLRRVDPFDLWSRNRQRTPEENGMDLNSWPVSKDNHGPNA